MHRSDLFLLKKSVKKDILVFPPHQQVRQRGSALEVHGASGSSWPVHVVGGGANCPKKMEEEEKKKRKKRKEEEEEKKKKRGKGGVIGQQKGKGEKKFLI